MLPGWPIAVQKCSVRGVDGVIRVGIYGGRGYVSRELIRMISTHPLADLVWCYSRESGSIQEAHRNLLGTDMQFSCDDDAPELDVVFLCAPTGAATDVARRFLNRGTKVICMGADFRLSDQTIYENLYGNNSDWDLQREAVYGIPEIRKSSVQSARLIANPGCFSTAAILALAPLIKLDCVDLDHVVVDGVSGTSGAGAALDRPLHHPEMCNTIMPYNVVDHRHTYEMEEQLSEIAGRSVVVHFTSHYGPFSRGILATCHAFAEPLPTRTELLSAYTTFYEHAPFVTINRLEHSSDATWKYLSYPSVADVCGSNHCQIGFDLDPKRNRIVVFSVIDNMGKGACSAAIQNMNILFGIDETAGIDHKGLGI